MLWTSVSCSIAREEKEEETGGLEPGLLLSGLFWMGRGCNVVTKHTKTIRNPELPSYSCVDHKHVQSFCHAIARFVIWWTACKSSGRQTFYIKIKLNLCRGGDKPGIHPTKKSQHLGGGDIIVMIGPPGYCWWSRPHRKCRSIIINRMQVLLSLSLGCIFAHKLCGVQHFQKSNDVKLGSA